MTQSRYEAPPPRSPRRAKVKSIRPPTPQVACSNLATLTLCIDLSDWWRGSSPPSPPPPHPAPLPLPPATRPGGGRRQPHQALNHHWCKAPQLQVTSNSRVSLQLWFGVGNIPEKMHSPPLHFPPSQATTSTPPRRPVPRTLPLRNRASRLASSGKTANASNASRGHQTNPLAAGTQQRIRRQTP